MSSALPEWSWERDAVGFYTDYFNVFALAAICYYPVIFGLRFVLAKREPFDLGGPQSSCCVNWIAWWEAGFAAFSIAGAYHVVPLALEPVLLKGKAWTEAICMVPESHNDPRWWWGFIFCVSKVFEFGDTLFIVLRKRELVFLHHYHHLATMLYSWYATVIGYSISNANTFHGGMNLCVHSVMYSWLAASHMGWRSPKICMMLVTALQILQMICALIVIIITMSDGPGCGRWAKESPLGLSACFFMYFSFLVLFAMLFVDYYICPDKEKAKQKDSAISAYITQQVAYMLARESGGISTTEPLVTYGVDSMAALELTSMLQDKFGMQVSSDYVLDGASIEELVAMATGSEHELDVAHAPLPEGAVNATMAHDLQGDTAACSNIQQPQLTETCNVAVVVKTYDLQCQGTSPRLEAVVPGFLYMTVSLHGHEYFYSDGIQVVGPSYFAELGLVPVQEALVGFTSMCLDEVDGAVESMKCRYDSAHFDLITLNNSHFSQEFVGLLVPHAAVPASMRRHDSSHGNVMGLWGDWYDLMANLSQHSTWTTMNYGFAGASRQVELEASDVDQRYALQMYEHVVSISGGVRGARVLEVGCGRGGGCSFLRRYMGSAEVVGVDLSRAQVAFCRSCHADVGGLEFMVADAMDLQLPSHSFDVVLNIESSHCYSNVPQFLSEASRVLRPGGRLLFADLRSEGAGLSSLKAQLHNSGLDVIATEDISANVVRALELDSAHKEALIKEVFPPPLHGPVRFFAACKGSKNYDRLSSGRWQYHSFVLRKPALVAPTLEWRFGWTSRHRRPVWRVISIAMAMAYALLGFMGLRKVVGTGHGWHAAALFTDMWYMCAVYFADVLLAAAGYQTLAFVTPAQVLRHHCLFLIFVPVALLHSRAYQETEIATRLSPWASRRWMAAALLSNFNESAASLLLLRSSRALIFMKRILATSVLLALTVCAAVDSAGMLLDSLRDWDWRVAVHTFWSVTGALIGSHMWLKWISNNFTAIFWAEKHA